MRLREFQEQPMTFQVPPSRWVLLLSFALSFASIAAPVGAQTAGSISGGTAQNHSGSISGPLTDPAGSVLRGAEVSIAAKDIIVSTDEQGRFFFSGLQPGDYTISVNYIGFRKMKKTVTV